MRKKVLGALLIILMFGSVQANAMYATLTGYCPCKKCCGAHAKNRTASGIKPSRGMCAAPRHIAFGTIIDVKGVGKLTVQDRGGAIVMRGNTVRIDVFFPTHKEALKFGIKRRVPIKIVKEGKR